MTNSHERIRLGRTGERAAEDHLRRRGCRVLARNFRTRFGEVDLIVRDGRTVCFVEVKTRRGDRCGSAAESVPRRKRRRIIQAAGVFLQRTGAVESPARLDVVAVDEAADGRPAVRWIRDAFRLEDG